MQEQNINFFLVASSVAILIVSIGLIFFVIFFFQSKKKAMMKAVKNKMQYQYLLSNTQTEVRQNTLHFISQELHDNVGQLLVVANLCSGNLKQKINPTELQELDHALAQAATEVRQISKSLQHQGKENFDLVHQLQTETKRIQKIGGLQFDLQLEDYTGNLSSDKEVILYRIIQEFITNTLKHAQATTISLSLRTQSKQLHLHIADDGLGYPQQSETDQGSGLKNMQARAAVLGATLDVQSEKNKGTQLTLHIPYKTKTKTK